MRTEKDRNGDGRPDVVAIYRGGQVERQEEDSDFDGRMDRKSAASDGGSAGAGGRHGRQRRVSTPGSRPTPQGAVLRKEEDRNGDGKKDLSAWFENGKLARVEQDTQGRGCPDLEQRFDANEKVRTEFRDTGSDCKMDVWSYFENERLVRQGLDTQGDGKPDVLNHLNPDGKHSQPGSGERRERREPRQEAVPGGRRHRSRRSACSARTRSGSPRARWCGGAS